MSRTTKILIFVASPWIGILLAFVAALGSGHITLSGLMEQMQGPERSTYLALWPLVLVATIVSVIAGVYASTRTGSSGSGFPVAKSSSSPVESQV